MREGKVDVKVVFLSELGAFVFVCVCVRAWEVAGVASISSSRPRPPVQGIAQLPSPSNLFAGSSQPCHKAVVLPAGECTFSVCVFVSGAAQRAKQEKQPLSTTNESQFLRMLLRKYSQAFQYHILRLLIFHHLKKC